jgi:anti-sigma B factor antagonist
MEASEIPSTLAGPDGRQAAGRCWVSVAVAGEIDIASAPEVLATLLAAAKSETAGIVVDVSAVTCLGAAGIGAFIRARNHEREHGRDLLLRAPPPIVARVLDICGLADLVEPPAAAEATSVQATSVQATSVQATGSATWRQAPLASESDR